MKDDDSNLVFSELATLTAKKINWAIADRVTDPGRYMFRFGRLTITADDLAIWQTYPNAVFTLIRTLTPGGACTHPDQATRRVHIRERRSAYSINVRPEVYALGSYRGRAIPRGDFISLLSLQRRPRVSEIDMFIAMNRFRVAKGSEAAFEQVWMSRDSHLDKVPGFVEFHLLKGPEAEDHTLYASHTVWENRAVFEAWTKSDAFRAAHSRAGDNKPLYLDHPQFEGFEVRQAVGRGKVA